MLKWLAALTFSSGSAWGMVLDPTVHAANALGYEIVGEFEFGRRSITPPENQVKDNVAEIRDICPRTNAPHPANKAAHFVILAWSDREYPSERENYSTTDIALADQRASQVAEVLKKQLAGPLAFELVNMATRQSHMIQVGERGEVAGPTYDVKNAMKIAGAAPSSRLELGLFGEYGQRSKAVVWVDCSENLSPRPITAKDSYSLVQSWGALPEQSGILVRFKTRNETGWI